MEDLKERHLSHSGGPIRGLIVAEIFPAGSISSKCRSLLANIGYEYSTPTAWELSAKIHNVTVWHWC